MTKTDELTQRIADLERCLQDIRAECINNIGTDSTKLDRIYTLTEAGLEGLRVVSYGQLVTDYGADG